MWPTVDAALFFDGDLLHGVLPAPVDEDVHEDVDGEAAGIKQLSDTIDVATLQAASRRRGGGSPQRWQRLKSGTGKRLTLMVGWWATDICTDLEPGEKYGPSAPTPRDALWVAEMATLPATAAARRRKQCQQQQGEEGVDDCPGPHGALRVVQPAWVDVWGEGAMLGRRRATPIT